MKVDIAIVGGGIIGSAVAYFLARSGKAGSIVVIEPDRTYQFATTPQGAGGVRQQFSVDENIQMSRYSLEFYKNFSEILVDIPDIPDIQFSESGYLFVVRKGGEETLRRNQALQASYGVNAYLMDQTELRRQFPSLDCDDIVLSCFTPDDGWIDPVAALWGFRKAAEYLDAHYINEKVTEISTDNTKVESLQLGNGQRITPQIVINTSGPWVSQIAEMTGAKLPVVPMCRVQHFWKCAEALEHLPLVKDETGTFFKPEGEGFVGGRPSFDIEPGFVADIHCGYFANYFEDAVWPAVAALAPKFENTKIQRSWAGHYAQNIFDGNMIIGKYSKGHDNLVTACGFSGHGIMHAPAVGCALSELVLYGKYQTMDLSRFEFARVHYQQPLPELGIK